MPKLKTPHSDAQLAADQALIREAAQKLTGGSLNKLGPAIGLRTSNPLGHVLAGRTRALDPIVREKITHLLLRARVAEEIPHNPRRNTTPQQWINQVMEHVLTCPECLYTAVIGADRHQFESSHGDNRPARDRGRRAR